ncbi:MAG: hypothetical protein LH618_00065 [Saprospiraceae bacterium]|nr:hypothetical protein [Saprospiraceae bacterium]
MSNETVLTDSCFWIAFFDPPSNLLQHEAANTIIDLIEDCRILIPWPTLYEFVNTRLARRRDNMIRFENFIRKPNVELLDDLMYRDKALEDAFSNNRLARLQISLVDAVMRGMLADTNIRINYLATFNEGDFLDICQNRGIQILGN